MYDGSWPVKGPMRFGSASPRAAATDTCTSCPTWTDEPPPTAARSEFEDVTVVVRRIGLGTLVQGTVIDYVTEGLNSALTFKNPNATAECGCGESFSVTDA